MATIYPFRALRPPPSLVGRVSCPPYDVLSTVEARSLAGGDPLSLLRVTRPEIDLPPGTDEHADQVYETGRRNLQELIARGALVEDPEPGLYLYAQQMGDHHQVGVVTCASVDDYDQDRIKKHEKTRADKEDDRTRHIDTLGAHDEPVFLTYRAVSAIDQQVAAATEAAPVYDFVSPDGVRHRLWPVPAPVRDELVRLFATVDTLYVADGHHRSASASRVHALRRGQPGEHDRFLAVIFPHDQLKILPYNRLVRDRLGRTASQLLEQFAQRFRIEPTEQPAPTEPHTFGLFLGDRWYRLHASRVDYGEQDPVRRLDVSICQEQILEAMFGIVDPRRDTNLDFVGGIRGAQELERRVREEGWTLALYLYPTRIEQLMEVSSAGKLMPPKSTWFEPKLRSGLFLHRF